MAARPELAATPHPAETGPKICLNMIVRNEAHVIQEGLDAVAPYITSWVIVDTGSDDGTQEVVRKHMASLGIWGDLHERPWRNFGDNRSEALALAQGHGEYIWVMDADDIVVGTPDFSRLGADVYAMRIRDGETRCIYWRRQLFRDGMPWHYQGVVHEYAHCDDPYVEHRLDGDYHIESRRLGGRNLDPLKYARDRDLLLAEVDRNPDDERSVFYLAQSYFMLGDFDNARRWSLRRLEMGGWEEEIYYSMFRIAESMARQGAPWPDVQDAFLRAWEFRPSRAEALHAVARRYRLDQRYQLGYLFASRAAEIPLPEDDILFVDDDVYQWRALDEKAVCASWIGRESESFALCRRILARPDLPEGERERIAGNRDVSLPLMIEAASTYPDDLALRIVAGTPGAEVTASLVAGPDRLATEYTLNSFLQCCLDIDRVGRFVVLDVGLSAADREMLSERYSFVEFIEARGDRGGTELALIRDTVEGRFWLHLGQSWQFFTAERFIGRLTAVLEAEPDVVQVAVNLGDAATPTGICASEGAVRRTVDGARYVIADGLASGPAMFDTARLDRTDAMSGLQTATLDEVLCTIGGVSRDRG